MSKVAGTNSLKPPVTPKHDDEVTERINREHHDKIVELQKIMTAVVKKVGGV